MDYNAWTQQLFENTYPRHEFSGGSILWADQNKVKILWGTESYDLCTDDLFQQDLEKDPVDSIISWAHRNLPLKISERKDSHIYWESATSGYKAVIERSEECFYTENIRTPENFANYGVLDRDMFTWSLNGSILCIESKIKGIPALCPLSHPISFNEIIDSYFYASPEIHLMIQVDDSQRVFIGHNQPFERIKPEERGIFSIPLNEWLQSIMHTKEEK